LTLYVLNPIGSLFYTYVQMKESASLFASCNSPLPCNCLFIWPYTRWISHWI